MVKPNYVSWRKMVRLLWNLPCTINSSLLMDNAVEKKCFFMGHPEHREQSC